jgi:hypothetical protein
MKKIIMGVVLACLTYIPSSFALPAFKGVNYSGQYLCKGKNEAVGEYEVTVMLKLNRLNSNGQLGVYDFSTETENSIIYFGQAVADGNRIALTFKLSKASNAEYSTGLGEFKKLSGRRLGFDHRYYEPDDNGGNYGTELCILQKELPASVLESKNKKTNSKQSATKSKLK